jgi:uncharacterized membrane protein YkoI
MLATRLSAVCFALVTLTGQQPIQARNDCLSSEETRTAMQEHRLISMVTASRSASAASDGEVLRARLCRVGETHVYVISALRRDGKVMHVTVDAVSGAIVTQP